MTPRRLSIPTRIFLGFAAVLTAFASVAVFSLLQHAHSARTLRLLQEGYLPLTLTVGEARATQLVFDTLLDRVLRERDTSATQNWLVTARRVRPSTLRRSLQQVHLAAALPKNSDDAAVLRQVGGDLLWVEAAYVANEAQYDQLSEALRRRDTVWASQLLDRLRSKERTVQTRLRNAWLLLQRRISQQSASAAEREQQAALLLGLLTMLALSIGIAVTWWSQRVLKPLPLLQQRVAAVARGDLSQRLKTLGRDARSDDEIGALGREFERMVEALAARDARLRDAAVEQQRLQSLREQTERLAAIGRWAAHITHEVRNPLSSIALNVELLGDELSAAGAGSEAEQLLRAIQKEIDRLHSITEEYLRLARLPTPRLEAEDLGEMVSALADFMRPEMQAAGVDLQVEAAADLPKVAIDEPQLRQALLNLLRNAREATPPGGWVRLRLGQRSGGVELLVQDNGAGIAAEARDKLFDLFYTTKAAGTGLGLPLTRQIIVAHGGRIGWLDDGALGTTFELWLPSADASTGTSPSQEPHAIPT